MSYELFTKLLQISCKPLIEDFFKLQVMRNLQAASHVDCRSAVTSDLKG